MLSTYVGTLLISSSSGQTRLATTKRLRPANKSLLYIAQTAVLDPGKKTAS